MAIQVQTSMMTGGLDLTTAPIAIPPGRAIAAVNYEPDSSGYTSHGGFERFNGRTRPSDGGDRGSILTVPGTGPVRGVQVFGGSVYAFRDQSDTTAGMFKSTVGGWEAQSFGHELLFELGTLEFVVGEYVVGASSAALGIVQRVVLRDGAWSGTAEGFLVLSNLSGTFVDGEIVASTSGSATAVGTTAVITLPAGGRYDFTIHNFYGGASTPAMYFVSGVGAAFEWTGSALTPIRTGMEGAGAPSSVSYLLGYLVADVTLTIASPGVATSTAHGYSAGQTIIFWTSGALPTGVTAGTTYYVIAAGLTANAFQFSTTLAGAAVNTSGIQSGTHKVYRADRAVGDYIVSSFETGAVSIIVSATYDSPINIEHFQNHLFLGFSSGALINSSIGEPAEYITTTGAGEASFGEAFTGMLTAASTSLMLFGQNRVSYLTGTDASTFEMKEMSVSSGAKAWTAQMMDMPMFMDDGGVRKTDATSSFGDWRMGSVTQLIEPLMQQKLAAGIHPVASLRVKARDQYKLYWDDGTGITVYVGRKYPETIPFKLPIEVYCACSGEVDVGHGDRLFVGAQDGYVYELNRGTSFDGAAIDKYIRLPFSAAGSPMQETRWTKATFELTSPDDITIGVAFDVDYARGLGGSQVDVDVDAGSPIISTDHYASIDWTQAVAGRLEFHLSGIGPNIAATLIHSSAVDEQHTISAQTYNFSRRRLKR